MGINNIIICKKDEKNQKIYEKRIMNYLDINKKEIIKIIKEEGNDDINDDNYKTKITPFYSIFYNQNLLILNFLKWCCKA